MITCFLWVSIDTLFNEINWVLAIVRTVVTLAAEGQQGQGHEGGRRKRRQWLTAGPYWISSEICLCKPGNSAPPEIVHFFRLVSPLPGGKTPVDVAKYAELFIRTLSFRRISVKPLCTVVYGGVSKWPLSKS